MENLIVGIILAAFTAIIGVLIHIANEHRAKLQELKPRIIEILEARVRSMENGNSSSNIFPIKTEELKQLSSFLPFIKMLRLNRELKEYDKQNKMNLVHGILYFENPELMLNSCKRVLSIIK